MELLKIIVVEWLGKDIYGEIVAFIISSLVLAWSFPAAVQKLPESSLLKKRVARIYLFTFRYFSPFKRRSKYKKHNKEFNSFKLTYYSDTSVEQHKLYHDFDENVYVKPDLKKISSLAREEEPDLMSDRQTIKAAGYRVSIEDFLNEIKKPSYGAIFIRGAAGFGKSNLCSHIAYSLSKDNLPVFEQVFSLNAIHVSEYIGNINKQSSLDRLLFATPKYKLPLLIQYAIGKKKAERKISKKVACPWRWVMGLTDKPCLLIIDGIDEVGDSEKRNVLIKTISTELSESPWKVIITGRPSSLRKEQLHYFDNSSFYEILPLTEKQIHSLSYNLYELIDKDSNAKILPIQNKSHDFLRRIYSNTTIEMASNPLLLTMMIFLDSSESQLPDNKPDLIKKVVEKVIRLRLASIDPKQATTTFSLLYEALVEMAHHCIGKGSQNFIREELRKLVEKLKIPKINRYYDLLDFFDTAGIIRVDESSNFRFVNRCYCEYLYAKHLVQSHDKSKLQNAVIQASSQEYTEVLYYLCCHLGNVSEVFGILLASEDPEHFKHCTDLILYSSINKTVEISEAQKNAFNSKLSLIKEEDESLYYELKFQIDLNRLRHSDPLAEQPLRFSYVVNYCDLDKNYHCDSNGFLVGLSPSDVECVIESINTNFSDERGFFSLPSLKTKSHRYSFNPAQLSFDSIVYVSKEFNVFKTNNSQFSKIRDSIKTYWLEEIIKYLNSGLIILSQDRVFKYSLRSLIVLVFDCWTANVFLEQSVDNYDSEDQDKMWKQISDGYHDIREKHFNSESLRASIFREHDIGYHLFGREGMKLREDLDERILIRNYSDLVNCRKEKREVLDAMIKHHFVLALKILLSSPNKVIFGESILCLSRLLSAVALQEGVVAPWGRVTLKYTPSIGLDFDRANRREHIGTYLRRA